MYHACPKRRVAKTTPTATANRTWADITAATAPPSSDPGVSDNNNNNNNNKMVSDSNSQPTRKVSPIPADDTLDRIDTALSEGRAADRDESRINKSTHTVQATVPPHPEMGR